MLSLCRFLAHHPEMPAAELVGCTARCGYSVVPLGLLPGEYCHLWALCLLQYIFVSLVVCCQINCGTSEDNELMNDVEALWGWVPPPPILMFIVGGQHVRAKYQIC